MLSNDGNSIAVISQTLRDAIQQLSDEEAPITYALIGCVIGVFIIELWVTVTRSLNSIEVFASGIFGVAPTIGWLLSPLLHRGFQHLLANLFGLFILGVPLEKHWSKKRYLGFLIVTGYLSTVGGGVLLSVFTDQQIASYGASGIVFALGGYGLTHLLRNHSRFSSLHRIVLLFGTSALLTVIIDPFTGPYFGPDWINGGHLVGLVAGGIAGWNGLSNCSLDHY
ncbi:rhomboid family intramembrane serine protease [Haloferax volcanii]|uniref:rhomboid family intramembrane serine protease n=1 Tax=Haloferax volcanii TaxID=2246 RepID=UPI003D3034A5